MDAADVRNLYEAYRSVYEDREYLNEDYDYDLYDSEGYILDEAQRIMKVTSPSGGVKYKEGKTIGRIRDALGRLPADKREISNREARDRELDRRVEASRKSITRLNAQSNNKRSERGIQSLTTGGSHYLEVPTDYRARRRRAHESVDLYDVVLDHLLDEGYCDDVDSAEIIMANMSEEWLDDILDEAVIGAKKGTIRSVIEKGGKSIKYVQSGGDIVAGDRSADLRAGAAEGKRYLTNAKNQRRVELANNRSIKRLNADPKHGYKDITIDGYGSVPTDYRARRRRASGR